MSENGCGCKHNQTNEKVFEFIEKQGLREKAYAKKSDVLGFGMFVVPAPEIGILEHKTVVVPGLNLLECEKRAATCKVFQWIPLGIEAEAGGKMFKISSESDLKAYLEALACDDCRGGCKMGCNCSRPGQTSCDKNPIVFAKNEG
jgi:hypothetical protein